MKRTFLLLLPLAVLLSGCGGSIPITEPSVDEDGAVLIGKSLKVRAPEGYTLAGQQSTFTGSGLVYTSWGRGELIKSTDENGEESEYYPRLCSLVSGECQNEAAAIVMNEDWISAAREQYETGSEQTITENGVDYTVFNYLNSDSESPYQSGLTAFACHDDLVLCLDLTDTAGDNALTDLQAFLSGITFL